MKNTVKSLIRVMIPKKYRLLIKYFGFRFKCPFCNGRARKFLPLGLHPSVLKEKNVVGARYRLNVECPYCGCTDRARLVYLYLANRTNVFRHNIKLLHVAPEPQLEKKFRECGNIDYLTADLCYENVMVKMDITNIQYSDSSFDVIICNHVLEHIVDDRAAMSELYRTLRPGGWAISQVPISRSLRITHEVSTITLSQDREKAFGHPGHVRIYGKDYVDRLRRVGFIVKEFQWTANRKHFGGAPNRFGLNEEENVYVAFKPKQQSSSKRLL